jgi:hypothetical protein
MSSFNTSAGAGVETSGRRLVVTLEGARAGLSLLAPTSLLESSGWEVVINPKEPIEADFWIVFGNARTCDRIYVAPENTLLIVLEPEEKKVYPHRYYQQFHTLIDTHRKSRHPRCELDAPCFDWHVGINHVVKAYEYGYEYLRQLKPPENLTDKISVVCSSARRTEGQIARLEFLEQLKRIFGDRLVHYGRGFQSVEDKMEAIYGYRVHLVLENCSAPYYWTEKLADAFLGWAFPVYYGCPNIDTYFPSDSLCRLSHLDSEEAASKITSLLDRPLSDSERSGVMNGRERILERYNPCVAWVSRANAFFNPSARKEWTTIRSHKAFRPFPQGLIFRLKSGSC